MHTWNRAQRTAGTVSQKENRQNLGSHFGEGVPCAVRIGGGQENKDKFLGCEHTGPTDIPPKSLCWLLMKPNGHRSEGMLPQKLQITGLSWSDMPNGLEVLLIVLRFSLNWEMVSLPCATKTLRTQLVGLLSNPSETEIPGSTTVTRELWIHYPFQRSGTERFALVDIYTMYLTTMVTPSLHQ